MALQQHAKWRWFAKFSSSPELSQLAMGEFVSELLRMHARSAVGASDASPKLQIFSAHDSTIVTILCVLGLVLPVSPTAGSTAPSADVAEEEALFEAIWPDYAALLEMQLVECAPGGKHEVQFLLNEQLLQTADGQTSFPLEQLQQLLDPRAAGG